MFRNIGAYVRRDHFPPKDRTGSEEIRTSLRRPKTERTVGDMVRPDVNRPEELRAPDHRDAEGPVLRLLCSLTVVWFFVMGVVDLILGFRLLAVLDGFLACEFLLMRRRSGTVSVPRSRAMLTPNLFVLNLLPFAYSLFDAPASVLLVRHLVTLLGTGIASALRGRRPFLFFLSLNGIGFAGTFLLIPRPEDGIVYFAISYFFTLSSMVFFFELQERSRKTIATLATDNRIVRNMANRDPLTGLANRRVFEQALEGLVGGGEEGALLLVDVDDFKQVNDSLGHQEGDRILRLIATVMQRCVRNSDLSSRIGGDEFALLLRNCDARTARSIAERICSDVARATDGVSVSVGLAMNAPPMGREAFMAAADRELYNAKLAGKGRAFMTPPHSVTRQ